MLAACLKGINDHPMTVHFLLPRKKFTTLSSVYAATMTNLERFYEDLKDNISIIPRADKLIILSDFNACVGRDHMQKHGVTAMVSFCWSPATLKVFSLPTVFCLHNHNKTSWMHPHSKHWLPLDYVILRQRDRWDVRVTRTMCGDGCWTDQSADLQDEPPCHGGHTQLNISKLKNDLVKQKLVEVLGNKLPPPNIDPHIDMVVKWARFHDVAASEVVGPNICQNQDWFDDDNSHIQTTRGETPTAPSTT